MDFYDFPSGWEWKIIPTDELIFFRGVGIPPTRIRFNGITLTGITFRMHYPGLSLLQHIKELKAHFQTTPYSQLPCLPGRGSCSWDVCASECRHICWPGVQGLSNWSPVVLVRCMVSPAMWCGGWWKHNDLRHRDSFSRTV